MYATNAGVAATNAAKRHSVVGACRPLESTLPRLAGSCGLLRLHSGDRTISDAWSVCARPEFGARKRPLRLGPFAVLDPSCRRAFEAVAARKPPLLRRRNQRELP